ncbi:hypothetical protein [Paraburkholderia sp. GAS348]
MNAQQEKSVVLTEAEFVKMLTTFRPEERAAVLVQMDRAVKGIATA